MIVLVCVPPPCSHSSKWPLFLLLTLATSVAGILHFDKRKEDILTTHMSPKLDCHRQTSRCNRWCWQAKSSSVIYTFPFWLSNDDVVPCRYLYIYYLPSGLFVVVSWVSFLIPPEVVPGRMALLVTLFLVLTNIFNTITNVSPNVEGMTAIASWMIACMFFVFLALLEYATILYFQLVSRTALNGKKWTQCWVLFQIRRKFQLVKKRRNLTVIHNKDCFLYQGSELNKRKDEISGIEQSQRWILRSSLLAWQIRDTRILR